MEEMRLTVAQESIFMELCTQQVVVAAPIHKELVAAVMAVAAMEELVVLVAVLVEQTLAVVVAAVDAAEPLVVLAGLVE
jgi:hypothetical protein